MNRKLLLIISVVTVLMLGSVLLYNFFIPSYIAEVITSDTTPSYLPEKYKIQIERINKPLNKYSEEAFKITDSLNLSLALILRIIDNINPDDVMKVYDQLEYKNVENSNEVFELIREHIEINEVDISLYRSVFIKYATPARINRALRYAETHELVANLAPSTAKQIARQIVIKHYKKEKISLEDLKQP